MCMNVFSVYVPEISNFTLSFSLGNIAANVIQRICSSDIDKQIPQAMILIIPKPFASVSIC